MQTYFKQPKKPKRRKRIRLKSDKKVLKEEAMALVRQIVFLRDGNKCLKCGRTDKLQLSHIYSQGAYPKMSLEPENCKILCWHCHLGTGGWHREPRANWKWLETVLPKARIDRLDLMAKDNNKGIDIKLRILWLQSELKRFTK